MKLFKENGFPTSEGKRALRNFENSLCNLLNSNEVRKMNVTQTRTLGSWLAKIVGDAIFKNLIAKEK